MQKLNLKSYLPFVITIITGLFFDSMYATENGGLTDNPPPQPVVNSAEWEPMSGVLIRYPFGLTFAIIAEISEDLEVMTIVPTSGQINTVLNYYVNYGVDTSNCSFLIAPTNSYHIRDYGPWYIFTGANVQGIADIFYNDFSRPLDNRIPLVLGDSLNIPVFQMPIVHAGGNYMSDGMGIGMSTDFVYTNNHHLTRPQVNTRMYEYTGVDNYFVMEDILTTGIHHIDCWAKLIDPGRIIVKRLTPPNAQLEANVALLENSISSYGKTYEVIRIDCASNTPYTNALILNNKVLVPQFNNPLDLPALQTWQNAMPGSEVLGFTYIWGYNDAIHCRTMGITDRHMLRIVHIPLFDRENNGQPSEVQATIHTYSNQPLTAGMPVIMWKLPSGTFNSSPMTNTIGDTYVGYIPAQPDYSTIDYYIHAEDGSGRSENHPYIGPNNPHHFNVLPISSIEITLTPQIQPIVIPAEGGSFNYTLNITNNCTLSVDFDCWFSAVMPDTNNFEIILRRGLSLSSGNTLSRQMTQNVPASAPAGEYIYLGKVGEHNLAIYSEDSFTFTKSTTGWGDYMEDWGLSGWEDTYISLAGLPDNFELLQNYPNPFNSATTISFNLPYQTKISLKIYNALGQEVGTLMEGVLSAGNHSLTWNASGIASGIYFYKLQNNDFISVKKCILLK